MAAQLAADRWQRVKRGVYVETSADEDAWARRRHLALARITAVARTSPTRPVVSHQSAALVWGLPLIDAGARVHIVQSHKPGARADPAVVRHRTRLPSDATATVDGISVTTLARTVVDCLLTLDPAKSVVLVDAALRTGVDRAACWSDLSARGAARGVRTARAVLEVADDGAESPGESISRLHLLRAGLPTPETQVEIVTRLGPFWADLGWREWRLVAEYDGAGKYGGVRAPATEVAREKHRQEALEDAGWRVVRLSAEDLRRPETLVARVLARVPDELPRLSPRPQLRSRP